MSETADERLATERSRFLKRTTDLRGTEAKAVAYTEMGYSWSAVAREMDTGESTAQGWIERAIAQYGLEIAETLLPEDLEPPLDSPGYEQIGPEYLDTLNRTDQKVWAEYFLRHKDKLPAEWAHQMEKEIRERALVSVGD